MIKLVIFDLDGTLVDSSKDILDAANKTLQFYEGKNLLSLEQIQKHIGEGFGPFMRHVAGIHDQGRAEDKLLLEEVFNKFQFFYDQQLMKHTVFYEGVEKFITAFLTNGGTKIGVVSNKPEYQVRLIIEGLGIPLNKLVEVYGGDTFEVKKPHPKPLEEMMKLAGVKPEETVMIGDSKADVEAAKSAGTHFIAVSFGFNPTDTLKTFGAEHFIDHFDELDEKIKVLLK